MEYLHTSDHAVFVKNVCKLARWNPELGGVRVRVQVATSHVLPFPQTNNFLNIYFYQQKRFCPKCATKILHLSQQCTRTLAVY
jgi:hypothetical protein